MNHTQRTTNARPSAEPTDDRALLIPNRLAHPIEEARQLLGGISRKSIYDLIEAGELRSIYIAGRRLIPAEAIGELIQAKGEGGFIPAARGRNPGAVAA